MRTDALGFFFLSSLFGIKQPGKKLSTPSENTKGVITQEIVQDLCTREDI